MLHSNVDFPSLTFPGIPSPQAQMDVLSTIVPTDQIEELLVYHSQLDKLNDIFNPDPFINYGSLKQSRNISFTRIPVEYTLICNGLIRTCNNM